MLTVPPAFAALVQRTNPPRATPADVAMLRALPPLAVPESYIDLVTQYGCPEFDAVDDACAFRYAYREPGFEQAFDGGISHFMEPARVRDYYAGLVLDEAEDLPKFPAFMLPIGLDWGQNTVLLECGGETDRIWFWEFQAEPWGEGDNVRLGFVADTLAGFLAGLTPMPD